jgi:hypothetical protein
MSFVHGQGDDNDNDNPNDATTTKNVNNSSNKNKTVDIAPQVRELFLQEMDECIDSWHLRNNRMRIAWHK